MPRTNRLEPAGVPLHVVQRGNNRAACFWGEIDRHFYLKCLLEYAKRRGCSVHAYALMTNHVHLLVTPGDAGAVSVMMQDIGRRYVRVINKVQGRSGTLWEGRFKSNPIDSETYFLTCHRYVELNPVRAGMVTEPTDYPWSSHNYYARGSKNPLISEHEVYVSLGLTPESRRKAFLSLFESPIAESDLKMMRTAVNRGWAIGSGSFLDQMETMVGRSVRPARRGRPQKQIDVEAKGPDTQPEMLF